jgi:hypothetical protein
MPDQLAIRFVTPDFTSPGEKPFGKSLKPVAQMPKLAQKPLENQYNGVSQQFRISQLKMVDA